MPKENNKMQVDIENLIKQNVNDLSSIKELYRKLKEVEEKILQIKYIDSNLANKLKKEYEKLKRIILEENVQAKLANDIKKIDTKLSNDIESINSQLNTKMHKNSIISMANMGQDVKEAMTGGSVAVVGLNSVDIPNLSGVILEQIGERISLSLTWEQNTHYRGDVGSTAQANTVSELYHTSIIEVKEGDIYTVNLKTQSKNQTGLMFVDDDMTIIKKELVGTGTTLEFSNYYFQIPVNATKLILCTYSVFGNISNTELNKISIYEFASKKYVNDSKLKNGEVTVELLEDKIKNDIKGKTCINLTLTENSFWDSTSTVAIKTDYTGAYRSYEVDVSEGEEYIIDVQVGSSSKQDGFIVTDNDYNILWKYTKTSSSKYQVSDYKLTIPKNGTKLLITEFYSSECFINLYLYSYLSIATKQYVDETTSSLNSKWKGKKLIIIGDSISDDEYNSSLDFVWTKGIKDYFGFSNYENYAIASSTIAVRESDPTNRTPLVSRFQKMSDDGDLILVSAITNDWFYQWTPLGTMESRDIYTLYGALHTLCLGLKKKYKGKTIKFLTGIMRRQNDRQSPYATNGLGKSLVFYNNIVKEVCAYYSIPVIDMFENCGLYPFDDDLALEYYKQQGSEGNYYYTHPNSNGQKMMFNEIINHI